MRRDTRKPAPLVAPVDPAAHFRLRVCQVCGRGHNVCYHVWPRADGRPGSILAHLRCWRQLQAGTATLTRD